MRQAVWIGSAVAALAALFGIAGSDASNRPTVAVAGHGEIKASPIREAESFFVPTAGGALATAAFGMSALQPETYNGDMVLDIIDASPLDPLEKRELADDLAAAERGRADLRDVLADVRVALAIE